MQDLIESAKRGDLEAFGLLVQQFQDAVYGAAYAILGSFHEAQDATQDVFVQAWRSLGSLKRADSFPGWLYRMTRNRCLDVLKQQRRRAERSKRVAMPVASEDDPAQPVVQAEVKEMVLAAVRSLSEPNRLATTLFYINGYSVQQVSEFLKAPPGTIKRRLHDSRKQLKERMMTMVEATLKEHALPEEFAFRLLMFPFPRTAPAVEIADCPGETMSVRCTDTQCYFTPLFEHGRCDWAFYDWPDMRLTGVNEVHVVGASTWDERTLLRVWQRGTEIESEVEPGWSESHILVEHDTWRGIDVKRQEPGRVSVSEKDPPRPQYGPEVPTPMTLAVGMKWESNAEGEAIGVSRVTIGEQSWKCLKVAHAGQHWKTDDGSPSTFAEWYIADTGRTVLFRRYNGAGYAKPDGPRSFESLEGAIEVEHQGKVFRHSYHCIPDIAVQTPFP